MIKTYEDTFSTNLLSMKHVNFEVYNAKNFKIHFHEKIQKFMQAPRMKVKIAYKLCDYPLHEVTCCDTVIDYQVDERDTKQLQLFMYCLKLYDLYLKCKFEGKICQQNSVLKQSYANLLINLPAQNTVETTLKISQFIEVKTQIEFFPKSVLQNTTSQNIEMEADKESHMFKAPYLKSLILGLRDNLVEPKFLKELNFTIGSQIVSSVLKSRIFEDPIFNLKQKSGSEMVYSHLPDIVEWSVYIKHFHQGRHFYPQVTLKHMLENHKDLGQIINDNKQALSQMHRTSQNQPDDEAVDALLQQPLMMKMLACSLTFDKKTFDLTLLEQINDNILNENIAA